MNPADSGRDLFLILCMALIISAPLVSWTILPQRHEAGARLWYAGALMLAVACSAFFIDRKPNSLVVLGNIAAGYFALVALRHELEEPRPFPFKRVAWAGLALLALHEALLAAVEAGLMGAGVVLALRVAAFTMLEWWAAARALRLSRRQRSRGMALVAIGLGALALANSSRLVAILGGVSGMEINDASKALPLIGSLLTFNAVTYSFGYLAYSLEKSWAQREAGREQLLLSQAREAAARETAEQLAGLVAQRDAMLMNASRVSAVNALGLYNAAIVHEISQPLQALHSVLDSMALRAQQGPEAHGPALTELADQAIGLSLKTSQTVQSLRRLMAGHRAQMQPVSVHEVIREALPILENEARRRGIELFCELPTRLEAMRIRAEPLLLQRLLMNLVGNSLDSISRSGAGPGRILLSTTDLPREDGRALCLRVDDDGPGFPPDMLGPAAEALTSHKPDGMGMGLTLTRLVMTAWGGELRLGRADDGVGQSPHARCGGARVDLIMPLA